MSLLFRLHFIGLAFEVISDMLSGKARIDRLILSIVQVERLCEAQGFTLPLNRNSYFTFRY